MKLTPKKRQAPSLSELKQQLEAVPLWCSRPSVEPVTLFVSGSETPITEAERKELIARVRAGEVIELELEAVTFIQRETPNRNFVRIAPKILSAFAKSFAGQPFLRDHAQDEQQARGGTIITSKLEAGDEGEKQIRMRLKLVKPWAVESALDGTLDRFSIGWHRTSPSDCSICKGPWLAPTCDHWPGLLDAKTGKVAELIVTGADGTEASGVNVPAVLGTRIESISQLSAIDPGSLADILAADASPSADDEKEEAPMKLLAALISALALPATSTEEDVLAAVNDQREELTGMRDRLTIAEAASGSVKERLAAIEVENAKRAAKDRLAAVDAGISQLIAAGKIKPGSETESALRRQGGVLKKADGTIEIDTKKDLDVFSASVADLLATGPVVTPVGAPLPANKPDPAPVAPTEAKAFLAQSPTTASWLAKAGIKPEEFEKHGENGRLHVVGRFGGAG